MRFHIQAWIRKSKLFIEWIWNNRLTLFVAFKRHIYISVPKTYNLKEITVTSFQSHEIGSELEAAIKSIKEAPKKTIPKWFQLFGISDV